MGTRARERIFLAFFFVFSYTLAEAREESGKASDIRGSPEEKRWRCDAHFKIEDIAGEYKKDSTSTKVGFGDREGGFGIACGYDYGRFRMEAGSIFSGGDLYITYDDLVLKGQASGNQWNTSNWINVTVRSSRNWRFNLHGGLQIMLPISLEFKDLRLTVSDIELNITKLAQKHAWMDGSLRIWEVGLGGSYRLFGNFFTSLEATLQRYDYKMVVSLDDYAENLVTKLNATFDRSAESNENFVVVTPKIAWCSSDNLCLSASVTVGVVRDDKWTRGITFKMEAPFF